MTATLSSDSLRQVERDSIRRFLHGQLDLFRGRVLDFGCGNQPHADIVRKAGGVYIPFDRVEYPANVSGQDVGPDEREWGDLDTILMTQVIQYCPDVPDLLGAFCDVLRGGDPGVLVATGATNWPVVEVSDIHRHTPSGVEFFLTQAGFRDVCVEPRASVSVGGVEMMLGWQCVAFA